MLVELKVRGLGVIEETAAHLGPGMIALTGETGAGKTLVVEALELLVGSRADPTLVREGDEEAFVEGRFVSGDEEVVVARSVPAEGRSRGWVNTKMAPVSALSEAVGSMVDLHGQHAHQALLDPATQRRALDAFGDIDLSELRELEQRCRNSREELETLGGDERERARELDLLRYQLHEIDSARIEDEEEDTLLAGEEDRLARAAAYREVAAGATELLGDDEEGSAAVLIGRAMRALSTRDGPGPAPLAELAQRLSGVAAEVADIAGELRKVAETWEDDPVRLAEVRQRRQLLHDLMRKYGEDLASVIGFRRQLSEHVSNLESVGQRAQQVAARLEDDERNLRAAKARVGVARRRAAPLLGAATQQRLRTLAMPKARVEISIGEEDPGDDVTFLLGANPGEPALALSKVASGGELARAMLALRLVLKQSPSTIVFDEVDAGIGGEAALAVGRALFELSAKHQVIVVTHLAQVAAFADRQLVVDKKLLAGRTVAAVRQVEGDERVVELARMLSGQPHSEAARVHAGELLAEGESLREGRPPPAGARVSTGGSVGKR